MTDVARKTSLLLADVDGTLVTHDKALTKRRKRRCTGCAIGVFASRSRAVGRRKGWPILIAPLEITTPIAGFNGGLFVRPDLSTIEERRLPFDVAKRALQLLVEHGLDGWLYAGNDWLIRNAEAPHVEREAWTVKFRPIVVDAFADESLSRAVKIIGVSDDHDRIGAGEADVQHAHGACAIAALSQP